MTNQQVITSKVLIAVLIGLLFAGYILFQARNLISGPLLTIQTPVNGASTSSPSVLVSGMARNISHLRLNDRTIFVDENGFFKEELLLAEGYTVVTVDAEDRFGRARSEEIEIVRL